MANHIKIHMAHDLICHIAHHTVEWLRARKSEYFVFSSLSMSETSIATLDKVFRQMKTTLKKATPKMVKDKVESSNWEEPKLTRIGHTRRCARAN
jgi:hypothetical protein